MEPLPRLSLSLAALLLGTVGGVAADAKPNRAQLEQGTRLQVFLDNANFGPGKIDGREGEFTRKALALYERSQGKEVAPATDPKAPLNASSLDLSSVSEVFTTYTVTKADVEAVGPMASDPKEQAKLKRLPYQNVTEAVAEKFHCDVDFLKELNPGKAEQLKEGDTVTVPNVKPFELGEVKSIEPGSEAAAIVANDLGEGEAAKSDAKPDAQKEEKRDSKKEGKRDAEGEAEGAKGPALSLRVSIKENMLEVHAADKIVAAFPVTVGSEQTHSPVGKWTVERVAKMPNFRYDKKMLNEGERSSEFHMLPPGPNNPVGVLWIALNKKGIGIHGTNDPDSIGRNASHGCIRLANWDVAKLAGMVKSGVPVVVE